MPLDILDTLRELVATPSVNPMGRAVDGPEYFEARLTERLEQIAIRHRLQTCRQIVAAKRDNLLVRVDGEPTIENGGALVLLEAHQDTVPVEGMTIPPFDPQVREGRMYGRGSCDNKGGLTAMLAAAVRLAEEQPRPRPTVVLACTVNEEHGFTGAKALCELWADAERKCHRVLRNKPDPLPQREEDMLPRRPDAAVIAEPTNLQIVVAHKGMVRWRCHALGVAAHSSHPEQGANAIFRMARVLAALEAYQREIVGTLGEHPLCGRATLSVGTIHGGLSVNTVPDRCTIEIDRRLAPGEEPLAARRQVIDFLAAQHGLAEHIEHEAPMLHSPGLNNVDNAAFAERLRGAVQAAIGSNPSMCGVAFGTDAALIAAAGVPCLVFGPGSIAQAHTAEECVPIVEVEQASEAIYRMIIDWPA